MQTLFCLETFPHIKGRKGWNIYIYNHKMILLYGIKGTENHPKLLCEKLKQNASVLNCVNHDANHYFVAIGLHVWVKAKI